MSFFSWYFLCLFLSIANCTSNILRRVQQLSNAIGLGHGRSEFNNTALIRSIADLRDLVSTRAQPTKRERIILRDLALNEADTFHLSEFINIGDTGEFTIESCEIRADSLAIILSQVVANSTSLKHLKISHCNLDSNTFLSTLLKLGSGHCRSNILTCDLSFNAFDSRSMRYLSTIISRMTLQSIILNGNSLQPDDIRCIVHCLRRHPTVSGLSLSSCSLTDASIGYIAFCLKSNQNITNIDLSNNFLSSDGIDLFLKTLRGGGGKFLEHIDLSYNALGDIGVLHLAKAFEANQLPKLKHLIMRDINAGHTSIIKLLRSLQQDNQLETLDISGNAIFTNVTKGKELNYYNSKVILGSLKSPIHLNNAVQSMTDILGKWGTESKLNTYADARKKCDRRVTLPVLSKTKSLHTKQKRKAENIRYPKTSEENLCKRGIKAIIGAVRGSPQLKSLGLMKVGMTQKHKDILLERLSKASAPQVKCFLCLN